MKCRTCEEDKVKSPVIRGKHVRFCDINGKIWNGLDCPDCYKLYNKERMRLSRLNKSTKSLEIP